MEFGVSTQMGKPVGGYDPRILMDMDDSTRQATMRQMGVANLEPPLPHSPCLKVIKTGVVHPWNALLAAQRDLVVCCDENGNTDPSAWESKVDENGPSQQELRIQAQRAMFVSKEMRQGNDSFMHYTPPVTQQNNDGKTEYERQGVISFSDIENLRSQLRK